MLGSFPKKEITVDGKKIKPVDVAAKLLLPAWQLEEGEEEYTVMRVTIQGVKNAKAHKIVYDLYDTYSPETNTSSMARTTGYTCTGAAQLLLSGRFTGKGIIAPEMLGANGSCFQFLLKHLKERNVFYKRSASDG
jgi:lysine 6-dehydrogenase